MAAPVARVVDAHVHFWDSSRIDWYPFLAPDYDVGGADARRMKRPYYIETYRAETAAWPVEKVVHVSAATAIAEETRQSEAMGEADGLLAAIIGAIASEDEPPEAIALLDEQMKSSRFRGVRIMGKKRGGVPHRDVLKTLSERNLVFELMLHPDELRSAVAPLSDFGDLTVVMEHTGYPRSADPDEFALWKQGIRALAALPSVRCKISGLSGPLRSMAPDAFRPWVTEAFETFGVQRCFFASDFPVASMFGTFDDLYSTFDVLSADLSDADREWLFAGHAESLYHC